MNSQAIHATAFLEAGLAHMQDLAVTYDKREAVVRFDDTKADVQKLTKATEEAGYPSSVKH